jgi:hypothetical protein
LSPRAAEQLSVFALIHVRSSGMVNQVLTRNPVTVKPADLLESCMSLMAARF